MRRLHGLDAPGHSSAPLRLHVSDTIRDVTDGVLELEEAVHARLGLPRPARARVPERLGRIARLLDEVAAHPVLARHVRDEVRRMARRCGRVLGDTEPVVRLPGRCPWCDSVSLRAFPARRAVLCVNPACRCSDGTCGCGDDPAYRHLWTEDGWAALAAPPAGRGRDRRRRRRGRAAAGRPARRGGGPVNPADRMALPTLVPGPLAAAEAGSRPPPSASGCSWAT